MWFRVEVHKDGSVSSCTEVEACTKAGKHVRYVEADSRDKACAAAVLWLERENARIRHHHDVVLPARRAEREAEETRLRALREGIEAKRDVELVSAQEAYRRRVDASSQVKALRRALKHFDENPRAFRAWLVSEIERLGKADKK